ncbi:MAG: hypothetical protein KDJ74_08475 [Notoacmeibacter sp.]|nr:hypothetical protein [Notoacmeibacter sp.]
MSSTIPKGGFRDEGGFRAWLDSLPEEQRAPFAQAIAHRAALRALPLLHTAFSVDKTKAFDPAVLTLAVFRANAISRVAPKYPTREIADAAARAAYAAARAAARAARAAYAAAYAAARAAAYAAARAAAYAARAARAADAAAEEAMWDAISRDARELEKRGSADGFEDTPLWPEGAPEWWMDQFKRLTGVLTEQGPNAPGLWSVWTAWYDAIVIGHSPWRLPRATANKLEKRIALGDGREDFWDTEKRSVAEINAEIAGWVEEARSRSNASVSEITDFIVTMLEESPSPVHIDDMRMAFYAENIAVNDNTLRRTLSDLNYHGIIRRVSRGLYEAVPEQVQIPQTKGALQFDGSEGEPIGVRKHASVEEWDTGPKAEKRHAEALRRLDSLLNQCREKSRDSNLLSQFLAELEAFRGVFGASVAEFDPDLAISQADALRRELARQKAHLAKPMDMDDINPLPGNLVQQLDNTMSAYNLFISLDDALSKRDEALLGPDAKRNLVPPREGQRRIEQAVEAGAAKPEVKEYLEAEAKPAPDVPDPENRLSRRYSESNKNYFRRHIEVAWNWAKLPAKIVGGTTSVGYATAHFVWHNRDWLVRFFDDSPTMLKILGDLLDILAKLPLG